MWHLFEVRSLTCTFQISVEAKGGLGGRGVSFGCENKCYEDGTGRLQGLCWQQRMDLFPAQWDNCCQGAHLTLSPCASLYRCSLLLLGMPCPCPRLSSTKAFCSPRLSSAELSPSAAIPTPSIKASRFNHNHISSSAPSFSPISFPLPPPRPLLYPTLQLPGVSLPRKNPFPVLADTTCSLSSCIISCAPRTLPRPLPILGSSLRGWTVQPKDATAASSGDVQHKSVL